MLLRGAAYWTAKRRLPRCLLACDSHLPSVLSITCGKMSGTGTGGAYATRASDTDFRKKWDKEEYAEKAKQKDLEERERMQENEERLKQGASSLPSTPGSYP